MNPTPAEIENGMPRTHPQEQDIPSVLPDTLPEYGYRGTAVSMHRVRERNKLMARVRKIRGQVEAIEKALAAEKGCFEVLQTAAAARGALSGLVAEIVEEHVRSHVLDPAMKPSVKQQQAADELNAVVRAYVR